MPARYKNASRPDATIAAMELLLVSLASVLAGFVAAKLINTATNRILKTGYDAFLR